MQFVVVFSKFVISPDLPFNFHKVFEPRGMIKNQSFRDHNPDLIDITTASFYTQLKGIKNFSVCLVAEFRFRKNNPAKLRYITFHLFLLLVSMFLHSMASAKKVCELFCKRSHAGLIDFYVCRLLEKPCDDAVFIDIDLFGCRHLRQARHRHDIAGFGDNKACAGAHLNVLDRNLEATRRS